MESDSPKESTNGCTIGNSQWYTTTINDVDMISISSYNSITSITPLVDLKQEVSY